MKVATLARDVFAALKARGYPIDGRYGKARFRPEGPLMQIRVQRARDTNDGFAAAPAGGVAADPKPLRAVRVIPVAVEIYTHSSKAGVQPGEEEGLNDDVVNAFVTELYEWTKTNADPLPQFTRARLMTDEERGAEAITRGEGYTMRFGLAMGVRRQDYNGEGAETGTPAEVETQVKVSLNGTDYEDVD